MRLIPQKGFTLIELLMVVAILGILVAIATYFYGEYQIRAQLAEAVTLGTTGRTAAEEFYNARGRLPESNRSAGMVRPESISGSYVTAVSVSPDRLIRVRLGNDVNARVRGDHLLLSAVTSEGDSLVWRCRGDSAATSRLLPASCRE
ncbi:pilin [Thioalkalivibrio sp. ALE19]|uniref:pilin n=1 Tax=Thioalkalivibrio sp. ALE19 TaxID=1266909 RepID=UPI0004224332|nr:pilin [Thioalkalivibrio sp. ALE19]